VAAAEAPAIETVRLSKTYGRHRGIEDVSLAVRRGEVFGYLGPNGAGKSTTIRLLLGMLRPSAGSARILGLDCLRDGVEVRRRVAYVPGDVQLLDPATTGVAYLRLIAAVRRAPLHPYLEVARRLDLDVTRRIREYSKGNRQKLALAGACGSPADVLILDEPTAGLDPLQQHIFLQLVREARDAGRTVFLSSHILSEVQHVCDRAGFIRDGRLIAVEPVSALSTRRSRRVRLRLAEGAPQPDWLSVPLAGAPARRGEWWELDATGDPRPLLAALATWDIADVTISEPTLEDEFLRMYREVPADGRAGGGVR
jgi:ABC-2 type transport system ATP-binding protein